MNWFIIALITPLAHAAVNHIDKHLISKYLKGGQVGSLVLFSALFAVVTLPFIGWFNPEVFSIAGGDALILILSGFLLVFAYICYFYALDLDEASFVAPMFQMIPVFGFFLSFLFLGEVISGKELGASLVVILGAIILSLELEGSGKIKFKRMGLLLMAGASFFTAINAVLFKFVTDSQQGFWVSIFWAFLGKVLCGVLIFFLIKSYRDQFLVVLKENKTSILSLNGLNEALGLLGEGAVSFAVLLAPVALVQVVSGFQPVFVLLYGVILTLFFPQFGVESMTKKHLVQKITGISIILVGSILLNLA